MFVAAIPIVVGAMTWLFGAKLIAPAAKIKIGSVVLCRRRGHRTGEGPLTRMDGDRATLIHPTGGDLGAGLYAVANGFQDKLGWVIGKRFSFTVEEGEDLRVLLQPIFKLCTADRVAAARTPKKLAQRTADVEAALEPVSRFLKAFPKRRVK